MNVFHVTRCIATPRAYGGFNRSQQILGILARHDIHCLPIDLFSEEFGDRSGNVRAGLAPALGANFPQPRSYARLWTAGRFHRMLAASQARHPDVRPLLIWESTGDELFGYAAAQMGLKVVALPHDLVTLNRVPAPEPGPELAREVLGLKRCDGLFTISREEQWLLGLFGCPADFLPYFPPAALEASLLRARQNRRPPANAPILLLGSISNPQTRAGVEHQLQLLRSAAPAPGRRVILAGNGTEALAALAGANVEVRGAVSDEALATLMAESAVLWTYQAAGTGALTRIVEALLAGLPVAGGGVALRSTAHLRDVYPVETVAELAALLPLLPPVAAQPVPPLQAEQELVKKVTALAA